MFLGRCPLVFRSLGPTSYSGFMPTDSSMAMFCVHRLIQALDPTSHLDCVHRLIHVLCPPSHRRLSFHRLSCLPLFLGRCPEHVFEEVCAPYIDGCDDGCNTALADLYNRDQPAPVSSIGNGFVSCSEGAFFFFHSLSRGSCLRLMGYKKRKQEKDH